MWALASWLLATLSTSLIAAYGMHGNAQMAHRQLPLRTLGRWQYSIMATIWNRNRLLCASGLMATIFRRYNVVHRRQPIVRRTTSRRRTFGVRGTVSLTYIACPFCMPRSSRFILHQLIYDPKKGGPPALQAVKSTEMSNDPKIQSCPVSWNGCAFVMVARFTPGEVVSWIWTTTATVDVPSITWYCVPNLCAYYVIVLEQISRLLLLVLW